MLTFKHAVASGGGRKFESSGRGGGRLADNSGRVNARLYKLADGEDPLC